MSQKNRLNDPSCVTQSQSKDRLKRSLHINGFFVNFDVKIEITGIIVWSKEQNMTSFGFQTHLLNPKIYS